MIIIWGTRSKAKILGITAPQICQHCGNLVQNEVIRVMRWFTLFWIPIFPFSIKYHLACPICKNDRPVNKAEAESAIIER
ncbi:MAG: zinc ribbon domain-containing protein [Oscillospiraceae bacterium]|jgi:hypothetical protein|nr:zinc ribbon domain-containing protein [Oscillospiraceae bacterium]